MILARARSTDELLLLRGRRTRGVGPFGSPNVARNASPDSFRRDVRMSGLDKARQFVLREEECWFLDPGEQTEHYAILLSA